METLDAVFKTIGCVGAGLGILNTYFLLRDRRRRLGVTVLSHTSEGNRGLVACRVANPCRQLIRMRAIRLMAFVQRVKEWRQISESPRTGERGQESAELPIGVDPGHAMEFNFSPDDSFGANIFGRFYVEVESELGERYRSPRGSFSK